MAMQVDIFRFFSSLYDEAVIFGGSVVCILGCMVLMKQMSLELFRGTL